MPYQPYSGAGQRFGVGVQTPGGALGFNLTPQEAAYARRRKLAQQFGLQEMPGIESLSEEKIASLGAQEYGRRRDDEERRSLFQMQQAAETGELRMAEEARAKKMQALKDMMGERYQGKMTPLEIEQMVTADPERAQQVVFGDWQQQKADERRAVVEQAKAKQRQQAAQALLKAGGYPEELLPQIEEMVEAQMSEPVIRQRAGALVQDRYRQQQEQAAQEQVAQQAKYYHGLLATDEQRAEYVARVQGGETPPKAFKATMESGRQAEQAKQERQDREMERQDKAMERRERVLKIEKEEAEEEIATQTKARAESQMKGADLAELAKQDKAIVDAQEKLRNVRERWKMLYDWHPAAEPPPPKPVGAPEPIDRTNLTGDQWAAATRGERPKAQSKPEKTEEAAIVRKEVAAATQLILPDTIQRDMTETMERLKKKDPALARQAAIEFRNLIARLPLDQDPMATGAPQQNVPPELLQAFRAVTAKYAGVTLEPVK